MYITKQQIYDDLIKLLSEYENNDGDSPVEAEDLHNMLNTIAIKWVDITTEY